MPLWREHVDHARRRADRAGRADLHPARAGAASRPRDHHRPGRRRLSQSSVCQGPRGGRGGRDAATCSRPPRGHHHGAAAKPASSPLLEPQPTLDAIQADSRAGSAGGSCSGRSSATSWRRSAASSTRRSRCRAGPTSGRCRSRTGSTCSPPASTRRSASACWAATSTTSIRGSEEVARVVKPLAGAVDVVADPIRGKPYIEIRLDRARAARLGVSVGEVNDLIETALAGKVVTSTVEGRERHPVVVRYGRAWREDEESIRNLPVTARGTWQGPGSPQLETRTASDSAVRGRRRPGRRGPGDDQERKRTLAQLCAAERPRPRRRRPGRRGTGGPWPETPSSRTASSSSGRASSSTRSVRGGRLMLVVPIVVALDLPGALPDLPRPGRRGADDAGGAGCDRRRAVLPVAAGAEALGDGLGRLHRLLRHGDLDRDHHAGLLARGGRQGRRTGADRAWPSCARRS